MCCTKPRVSLSLHRTHIKMESQSTVLTYQGHGAWYSVAFPACPAVSGKSLGTARHLLLHKAGDSGRSPPVLGHRHPPLEQDLQKQQEGVNEALNCIARSVGAKGSEVEEFSFHKYSLSWDLLILVILHPLSHPPIPPSRLFFFPQCLLT